MTLCFSLLLACRAAVEDDLADFFGKTFLAIEGSCDELCECEVLRAEATSSLASPRMGLQPNRGSCLDVKTYESAFSSQTLGC